MARAWSRLLVWSAIAVVGSLGAPLLPLPESEHILGGSEVPPGKYGYVGLYVEAPLGGSERLCTVVLVSPSQVITAAHCVPDAKNGRVYFGEADLQNGGGIEYEVKREDVHPQYTQGGTDGYDIAVLTLTREVEIPGVKPVNVPDALDTKLASRTRATAVGYGQDEDYLNPRLLRKVELPLVASERCEALDLHSIYDTHLFLCAGGPIVGQKEGICNGDSGGPLVVDEGGTDVVIGVASFVIGHCGSEFESVFTSLADANINKFVTSKLTNPSQDVDDEPPTLTRTRIKRARVKSSSVANQISVAVNYVAHVNVDIEAKLFRERKELGSVRLALDAGVGSVQLDIFPDAPLMDDQAHHVEVQAHTPGRKQTEGSGLIYYFVWPDVTINPDKSVKALSLPIDFAKDSIPVTIDYKASNGVSLPRLLRDLADTFDDYPV